jgi:para-nitrobenzyl esterase
MKLFFIFLINIFLLFSLNLNASNDFVYTQSGVVEGLKKNRSVLYQDIPYAQPPVGNLRWKAPRTLKSSDKILPKDENFCIQRPSNLGGAEGDDFYAGSEDCLYLDIYTPSKVKNDLPVMFWIHGGGNTSGLKDLYDFSKMVSKHDVIVVAINYRLGPMGWFTHPAIQEFQDGDDKTSNFGTLDIIHALKWVNNNISKFGGNPDNVTIFGESAGGHNVLSLLVSDKAKGLFHKAISMSGYTTSISTIDAYNPTQWSSTSNHSSYRIVERLLKSNKEYDDIKFNDHDKLRDVLLNIPIDEFFIHYAERASYEEIPLLTADGVVIPGVGLDKALSMKEHLNIVPTIAGSNRDEVKLWLATAEYFVELDYSFLGSILKIPKVKLKDKDSFEAFNYYRSSAWKIRGVDRPLNSLINAGNNQLYAYRYDWDDHRKFFIADFKTLIGAAHATEIPLLTGSYKLVGGYPLSDLIYPPSVSKRYLSKNMMTFWTNFAKNGYPGSSTNKVVWDSYISNNEQSNFMILDKKQNLSMKSEKISFRSLTDELIRDKRVNNVERCVIFLQMFTYVGDDLYEDNINKFENNCSRDESQKFIIENASYIEY